MQCFEDQKTQFKDGALVDWQPMQLMESLCCTIILPFVKNKFSSHVLNALSRLQGDSWQIDKYGITVVEMRHDQHLYQGLARSKVFSQFSDVTQIKRCNFTLGYIVSFEREFFVYPHTQIFNIPKILLEGPV